MTEKFDYYDMLNTGITVGQTEVDTPGTELGALHTGLQGCLQEFGLTHGGSGK